jgi:predicted transcriptional regulator
MAGGLLQGYVNDQTASVHPIGLHRRRVFTSSISPATIFGLPYLQIQEIFRKEEKQNYNRRRSGPEIHSGILSVLDSRGPASLNQIVRAVNLNRKEAKKYLDELIQSHLAVRQRGEKYIIYSATESGLEVLKLYCKLDKMYNAAGHATNAD